MLGQPDTTELQVERLRIATVALHLAARGSGVREVWYSGGWLFD